MKKLKFKNPILECLLWSSGTVILIVFLDNTVLKNYDLGFWDYLLWFLFLFISLYLDEKFIDRDINTIIKKDIYFLISFIIISAVLRLTIKSFNNNTFISLIFISVIRLISSLEKHRKNKKSVQW